jgi:hypothetical protein
MPYIVYTCNNSVLKRPLLAGVAFKNLFIFRGGVRARIPSAPFSPFFESLDRPLTREHDLLTALSCD